jgi:hypothetical protein
MNVIDAHLSRKVGQFNILIQFCSGFASIFANITTLEFDFSILGWEKDEY